MGMVRLKISRRGAVVQSPRDLPAAIGETVEFCIPDVLEQLSPWAAVRISSIGCYDGPVRIIAHQRDGRRWAMDWTPSSEASATPVSAHPRPAQPGSRF
jgi:hypothetical protein